MDSNIELILTCRANNKNPYVNDGQPLKYQTPVTPATYVSTSSAVMVVCMQNTIPSVICFIMKNGQQFFAYIDYDTSNNKIIYKNAGPFYLNSTIHAGSGFSFIFYASTDADIANIAKIDFYNYFNYVAEGQRLITIPGPNDTRLATTLRGPGWTSTSLSMCVPVISTSSDIIPIMGLGSYAAKQGGVEIQATYQIFTTDINNNILTTSTTNQILYDQNTWLTETDTNIILHWNSRLFIPVRITYDTHLNTIYYKDGTWHGDNVILSDIVNGRYTLPKSSIVQVCFIATGGEPWIALNSNNVIIRGRENCNVTLQTRLATEILSKGGWLRIQNDAPVPSTSTEEWNSEESVIDCGITNNVPWFTTKYLDDQTGTSLTTYTYVTTQQITLSDNTTVTCDIWSVSNDPEYYRATSTQVDGSVWSNKQLIESTVF